MLQLRLTAAAQPRNVSVNVPTSSAKYFFMSVIFVNIELCRNNNADSAPLLQYVNIKKKGNQCFNIAFTHSSMSHLGVEVAPQIPTLATPSNHE